MEAFAKYFIDPIKNHYVDFGGRATRTQYWAFWGFSFLLEIILGILVGVLSGVSDTLGMLSLVIVVLFGIAILLPSLAIAARRLRDGGFSPWLLLVGLIPGFGGLILLILLLLPSKN